MQPADRLIIPLDVPTFTEAIALVERLPQVRFWKVGLELFVNSGAEILPYLKEQQKRIFLDLKFHDIPNTMAGACRSAARYEVDLLTVHAGAGKRALETAIAARSEMPHRPQVLAVTVLTSIDARALAFELKVPLELPEYALQMALLARDAGLDGAVCSPQEAKQLRQVCGREFLLVCPGVRPKLAAAGDQKRTLTPARAIAAGADYLVIGRPITAASDPQAAWEAICTELETGI